MPSNKHTLSVTVRVPATTSNLGPGLDTFGAALRLYNTIEVRTSQRPTRDAFLAQAAAAFFRQSHIPPCAVQVRVRGRVPRARGLGSSVTVRAGIICGLNKMFGAPLSQEECLRTVISLEGHPDNATAAFLGGFTISSDVGIFRASIRNELRFIAVVPDFEIHTTAARRLLPTRVRLSDAITNLRHSALISAAFASGNYTLLRGAFQDHLHQPYRKHLIPGYDQLQQAAYGTGALGFFLSGSGPTVIALTDSAALARKLPKLLCDIFTKHRIASRAFVLSAHNEPL